MKISSANSRNTRERHTCTKKGDTTNLDTHFLADDVLQYPSIHFERRSTMKGGVGLGFPFPVGMFGGPLPLEWWLRGCRRWLEIMLVYVQANVAGILGHNRGVMGVVNASGPLINECCL